MKKFDFSLDKVLTYKEQIEENLKIELAEIIQKIKIEEEKKEALEQEYTKFSKKLEEEKRDGCTILRINFYEGYLLNTTYKIKMQEQIIIKMKETEEKKRQEVIEAKKETKTITKLKEKKIEEYNKEVLKNEESFIEEFVSTSKFMKNHALGSN